MALGFVSCLLRPRAVFRRDPACINAIDALKMGTQGLKRDKGCWPL